MGHECRVPATSGTKRVTWRCPDCGHKWTFQPDRTHNSILWGRADTRMPNGSKPKPWLSW